MGKDKLQIAKAYLKKNLLRLMEWTIGDVKRCSRLRDDGSFSEGGALYGAFILWVCAVDYWGGVYTNFSKPENMNKRFKAFVTDYLRQQNKRYNYVQLYELRNAITHYYTLKYFVLAHEPELNDKHLRKIKSVGRWLVLKPAITDLENAILELIEDIKGDDKRIIKAFDFCKEHIPQRALTKREIEKLATNTQ